MDHESQTGGGNKYRGKSTLRFVYSHAQQSQGRQISKKSKTIVWIALIHLFEGEHQWVFSCLECPFAQSLDIPNIVEISTLLLNQGESVG